MADLMERYKAVRTELMNLQLPWDFPPHAIWRIAAVTSDEAVRHVDAALDEAAGRKITGSIIVFTDHRVVLVTMIDSPRQPGPDDAEAFSVSLKTWSRSALRTVEMAPDRQEWRNSDSGWSNLNAEPGYPVDIALTLHYEGRKNPVDLPLSNRRNSGQATALFEFLPALLADMSLTP